MRTKTKIVIFIVSMLFLFILIGCDGNIDNRQEFTVSFITNCDMEISDMKIKDGDTIPFNPIPENEGYSFVSWDNDISKPITSDITFTAIWELANYSINYDKSFDYTSDNPESYTINDTIVLNDAKKNGFIFEGWYTDQAYTKKIERIKKGTTGEINIYPKFTEVTYSINYHLDGGINAVDNPSAYKASSESLIYLKTPSKEDYSFIGWYTEESYINLVTKINPNEAKNYELFARFTKDSLATSNIKFELNGGEAEINHNFDYTSKITSATATMFLMYDSQKGEYASVSDTLGNLYFYYICLKATDIEEIYQIVDIAYRATDVKSTDFDYCIGWHASLLDTESKTALTSIYNSRADMLGGYVRMEYMPDTKSSKCEIELSFYPSSAYSTQYIRYKNPIILPIPTKEGYSFLGWTSSLDGEKTTSYPGYYESKTITYTAQWIKNEFVGTNIEKAIEEINYLMAKNYEVEDDLELPNSLYNCTITWKSNNEGAIDNLGHITRTAVKQEVTLLATIKDNEKEENVSFTFNIKGKYHDLTNGIKAGYFYYNSTKTSDYTFRNLDIMFMAFGNPTVDGSISNYETTGNLINKNFVQKAHPNGVRVMLSINTKNCATIAASESLTNTFADNLVRFVVTYELDGIDLDWEYPASNEATNFTRLAKTIKEKLMAINKDYLLTAAVGSYQASRYDLKNSQKYLDYISIMTYDMQSGGYSSHQSAIHAANLKATYNIDGSFAKYSAVYPASRIILGIPFYARVWTDSKGPGTKSTYKGASSYSYIYNNYVINGKESWDEECQVPYVYDAETGYFAAYDNPKSIAIKATYAKNNGMAGMMYWEDGQDHGDDLVTAMVDEVNKNFR